MLNSRALEAAMDACPIPGSLLTVRDLLRQGGATDVTLKAAITAYLTASMPEDVKGLVAEWTTAAEGVTSGPWRHYQVEDRAFVQRGPEGGFAVKGLSRDREQADAAWIARCSPSGIRTLLDALASLSAKVEELTRRLSEQQDHVNHADAYQKAAMSNLARAEAAEAALAERDRIIAEKDKAPSAMTWRLSDSGHFVFDMPSGTDMIVVFADRAQHEPEAIFLRHQLTAEKVEHLLNGAASVTIAPYTNAHKVSISRDDFRAARERRAS